MLKRIDSFKGHSITVGVHGDAGNTKDGKASLAEVAVINEYGLGVPQRPFIGSWFEEMSTQNAKDLVKMGQAVTKGKLPNAEIALAQIGEKFVGDIQRRMAAGTPPANAPATIKKKGSDVPLIDTGQLRAGVRAKVA